MAFRGGTTGIELRGRVTEKTLTGRMTVLVLGVGIIQMALRGRMKVMDSEREVDTDCIEEG